MYLEVQPNMYSNTYEILSISLENSINQNEKKLVYLFSDRGSTLFIR
jgi:hypothetical protein